MWRYGNLQQIITLLERITHLDQFKAYFTKWKQSWYFAKPDDTNKLLEEIGYVNTRVYSNSDCIILPNRHNIFWCKNCCKTLSKTSVSR